MLDLLQDLCASPRHFHLWAIGTWLLDLALTSVIVARVPFTNIDWDSYAAQVDAVLGGEFDYGALKGPAGPIAYPAGFCWIYGAFRLLNLNIFQVQLVFGVLYMLMMAVVFRIYRRAGAPGWILLLCMLSKRVHSIFVLRLFNDAVAQLFDYVALLLALQDRLLWSAVAYSLGVSVKMHPLLHCPAVGLFLVLRGGWSLALRLVSVMLALQVLLALPFLLTNPGSYLARAFGGPGDLQHVWSVNWRMLPEGVFTRGGFRWGLHVCHLGLLAWLAQTSWIPGGIFSGSIWCWSGKTRMSDQTLVVLWFSCNFIGICCLRTIHFQYLVWYFHSVPLLAWYALRPEQHRHLGWVLRCAAVAAAACCVELPFLLTTRGTVRGPDGRSWETDGVPTRAGSCLLLAVHTALLGSITMIPKIAAVGKES